MINARLIREYESYIDMSIQHQKDVDQFPMCFIMGRPTTKEAEDELFKALGTRDFADVTRTAYGGLILKKDEEEFYEMFRHHDRERKHFENSFNHLVNSITTEMRNHEYALTGDTSEVLTALHKSADAFLDARFALAWQKASERVLGKAS